MNRNPTRPSSAAKTLLLFASLILAILKLDAQDSIVAIRIRGDVRGGDGHPLALATVLLKDSSGERSLAYALTDKEGRYILRLAEAPPSICRIVVEHVQMRRAESFLQLAVGSVEVLVPPVRMEPAHRTLDEIVVKAAPPPIVQKGDTIVYRAAAFANAETRKVEDLLRRMPGFQVGSDGRIHFNGREVDRILIDGDDLTERNYRLLSKSLQAGIVDKVEVLQTYHPDRLLRAVEHSERVGVNLRTERSFRNRPSGELGPGIGTSQRSRSDAQIAWLSDRLKAMGFLDVNRTAGKPGVGLQSVLEDETTQTVEVAGMPTMPIQTGRVSSPGLDESYVRDNRDASAIQLLSAPVSVHARIRMVAAMGSSLQQTVSDETNEFLTPDAGRWILREDRSFREELSERSARLVFTHDRGGRNTGNWAMELGRRNGATLFHDRVGGAIRDDLSERLEDRARYVHLRATETFSLPRGKVLRVQYRHDWSRLSQNFDIETDRWAGAFGIPMIDLQYLQVLDVDLREQDAAWTLHGRSLLFDWRLGLDARLSHRSYTDSLTYGTVDQPLTGFLRGGSSRAFQGDMGLSGSFEMRQKKRWTTGASFKFARGQVTLLSPTSAIDSAAMLYRVELAMRREFSQREKCWIRLGAWRELPSPEFFLPERLDGEVVVRAPVLDLSFADRRSLQVSYVRQDLAKARSMVLTLGGGHDEGVYVPRIERQRAYARIMSVPSRSRFAIRAGVHAEAYVDAFRARSVSDLSWFGTDSEVFFNGIPGRSLVSQLTLGQKWIGAFDGWFNMEGGWRSEWMVNATRPTIGDGVRFGLWQHHGFVKAKADWEGRPYLALLYGWRSLEPGTSIGTLDLFASLRVGKSLRMTMTCHNLTGVERINLGSVGTNERGRMAFDLVGRYLWAGLTWSM